MLSHPMSELPFKRVSMVYRLSSLPAMAPRFGHAPDAMAQLPAICRRLAAWKAQGRVVTPNLGRNGILTNGKHISSGRGAAGRVLCLSVRAPRSDGKSALLRTSSGRSSVGADKRQAMVRPCKDWGGVAGATALQGMANLWHASFRASQFEGGSHLPPQPCMNELPAHAPNSFDRSLRPDRLYACTDRSGFQKLHRGERQRTRVSGDL